MKPSHRVLHFERPTAYSNLIMHFLAELTAKALCSTILLAGPAVCNFKVS